MTVGPGPGPIRTVRPSIAEALALGLVMTLVAVAFLLPALTGWDVASRAVRSAHDSAAPPLHGWWRPSVGAATPIAIAIGVAGFAAGPRLATRLRWELLVALAAATAFAWMLALALVDGPQGLSRAIDGRFDLLPIARGVDDPGALLRGYVSRIPKGAPDSWPTQAAGHPPGLLLVFVLLVHLGLGEGVPAGIALTALAASSVPAVLVTLRVLGAERPARRLAPALALSPAAVFIAVSDDAVIVAISAWGIAALALAATRIRALGRTAAAVLVGLLLGGSVLLSYGMVLLVPIAIAVLIGRSWVAGVIAAASGAALLIAVGAAGFPVWEAYPVLRDRYWAGIASRRPYAYWVWANLAALALSAGPGLALGLRGSLRQASRAGANAVALRIAAGAAAAILVADLSGMSLGEVERIWLPFVPWLTLVLAGLDGRGLRLALAVQIVTALAVQHLLYTSW